MPLSWSARLLALLPGLAIAIVCAVLAKLVSTWTGIPAMVIALALGLAAASALPAAPLAPGVDFAVKPLLRWGVALLGAQLTLGELQAVGWGPVAIAIAGVFGTVLIGSWIGRRCGLSPVDSLISATSVGVCGASAALAASAALPRSPDSERTTLLVVAGANILSTIAMVSYPLLGDVLGWDAREQGLLFGLSIHDVAQVVGAGLIVGPAAVHGAALIKLVRVACLMPVVVGLGWWARRQAPADADAKLPPLVPGFLLGFALLATLASFGVIPDGVRSALSTTTSWLLTIAVAALGLKTSLRVLVGARPQLALAMILQSLLILAIAVAGLALL
jgi:uncharacterized integral membrane protein (TIGR00698 family)